MKLLFKKALPVFILFISCKSRTEDINKKYKNEFINSKNQLNKSIDFVNRNYFEYAIKNNLQKIEFVFTNKNRINGIIVSDTNFTKLINKSMISSVSFEKQSNCLEKYYFDVVIFKIKNKENSSSYSFVYEFCPFSSDTVITNRFESYPLESNWFLNIEK